MASVKKMINETARVGIILFLATAFLSFPKVCSQGISDGIKLCAEIIIPSLFSFMFLADFIITSGFYKKFDCLEFLMRRVFKQPACSASVIFMSLIGGFPIGAKMTAGFYEKGKLTENEAQRLLMFCTNAGPAFVINAVGIAMLGNWQKGAVLCGSLTLSSLLIGVATRFFAEETPHATIHTDEKNLPSPLSTSFVSSVSNAVGAMLNICGFVILFSCLGNLSCILNIPENIVSSAKAISEVTTGCCSLANGVPLEYIALILGWSGICVHFQVMEYIVKCKARLWLFLCGRVLSAVLSFALCKAFLHFFPISVEVFAPAASPSVQASAFCIPATVCLAFMGAFVVFEVAKNDTV